MSKKIAALLPMKANSERVKGKNFKELGGKPLFQWILDTLLSVSEINQVIINTDARQMLSDYGLVENEKVVIRDRRSDLCGDFVSMNAILADDISAINADCYLMTHTTNPLISSNTIRSAIHQYLDSYQHDSLFTVNKIQTRFYRQDTTPVNHNPDKLLRTQDLEPWYEENSCLYIFSKDSFHLTNARIGKNPQMMETPPLESLDIDEPADWTLVEALVALESRKVV